MDAVERIRADTEANRHTPEFELEWLLLDLEEQIWAAMQAQGIARSELAERLGTSRAFVTKLLSGHENLTLKTLVRVANALEIKVELRMRPRAGAAPKRRVAARAKPAVEPSRRVGVRKPGASRRTPSAAARSRTERTKQ
ncbi:MAG: helix-turn-helix domain-containing protein [Dehalococcoidia bacterium]